jgi:hypothetical protein
MKPIKIARRVVIDNILRKYNNGWKLRAKWESDVDYLTTIRYVSLTDVSYRLYYNHHEVRAS